MLRYLSFTLVYMLICTLSASAQQFQEDVIYLKDGSIVRGIIIEDPIPNDKDIKIKLRGGTIKVIKVGDIFKKTKELSMQQPTTIVIKNEKSPGVAFLCSVLFVGAGQVYNEDFAQAYIHWGVAVFSIAMAYAGLEDNITVWGNNLDPDSDDGYATLGIVLGLTNWVTSMISAPAGAERFNERNRQQPQVSIIKERVLLKPYNSQGTQGAMLSLQF